MCNAAFQKFPNYVVNYQFDCRNESNWTKSKFKKLEQAIDEYCKLRFKSEEIYYLKSLNLFNSAFLCYLRTYQPNRDEISVSLCKGKLHLTIRGSWLSTIFYEVPLLAMINEVYFSDTGGKGFRKRLNEKSELLKQYPDMHVADFGTRRRKNLATQIAVCMELMECPGFVGTSNVYIAKELGITPIGTMAHEWIMAGAGRPDCSFIVSQKAQLQTWSDVYRGDLGIALTDTYGMKKFLADFDLYFAKLYDGLRHDSGDPYEWGDLAIEHYEKLGIDPMTKTLVFSDGLTVTKAIEIFKYFKGRAKISFGIGTHFTNDFEDIEPLKIVIKMIFCNDHPTIKMSDEPAKTVCKNEQFKKYAMYVMLK